MTEIPGWIRQAREKWIYRGQHRPEFAQSVKESQESVWDYPRPPCVTADSRQVVVQWRGTEIANTKRALRVQETASPPTFYLPPADVRMDLLERSPGRSMCEWKGEASYWSILVPQHQPLARAAWSYEEPFDGFEQIAAHISFYPAILECYVDAHRVEPQPGNLYGGWVTPEVVGPFKGEAGTESW